MSASSELGGRIADYEREHGKITAEEIELQRRLDRVSAARNRTAALKIAARDLPNDA